MKRTLAQFAARCGGELRGADREFAQVLIDSRRIAAGDLFCALPGTRTDGHEFVAQAAAAGAAAALVSRPVDAALAQIVVADVAQGLVQAARARRAPFTVR
jgi:UDP-N-acetylmuramoyl-tripeptide--D-alanyl-D-alanine ligase